MSAWCLLPVLLLLHQVTGHLLPVPQHNDGGGQDGGGQDGDFQDGGGQDEGGQVEDGQDGGYQDGGGQDGDKHNIHVAMTRINQVNL